MKKKMFGLCCALGIGTTTLFAQQGIVSTGGNAGGTGGSVSYSIGQVFSQFAGTSGSMAEGMQQPYEISVVTDVNEATAAITLDATVYPVPATDIFTLRIGNSNFKNLKYVLIDNSGKLITRGEISSEETVIPVSHLSEAHYYLSVYESDQTIKTFKIIKSY